MIRPRIVTQDVFPRRASFARIAPVPDDPTRPHFSDAITRDDPMETTRMSFGDHLDELRRCLIRGLIGVALALAVTLTFGREILEIIFRPLWTV